ncbi:MAG: hypothetical protein IPM96_21410 [Ignavibacteria bacterium]|nr:hypothetical protein [Ignavibacteria bacterium]
MLPAACRSGNDIIIKDLQLKSSCKKKKHIHKLKKRAKGHKENYTMIKTQKTSTPCIQESGHIWTITAPDMKAMKNSKNT